MKGWRRRDFVVQFYGLRLALDRALEPWCKNVPGQRCERLVFLKARFASARVTAVLRPMAEGRRTGGFRVKMNAAEVCTTHEDAKRHMRRALASFVVLFRTEG